jgi:hypothetical protein
MTTVSVTATNSVAESRFFIRYRVMSMGRIFERVD